MNALEERYEVIEVLGKPVLFTESRIDWGTLPEGLYNYDIRHDDDDWSKPVTIEENILVNHFGTIISKEPIEIPESGYLELVDGEIIT